MFNNMTVSRLDNVSHRSRSKGKKTVQCTHCALVTYQAEEEEDEADNVCAGTSLRLKGCRHLEIDTPTLQKVLFDGFSLLFISLLYCVGFHHLTRSSLSLTGSQYKQNLHTSPTPSWVATGAYQ